jgi:hypothetical protein
MALTFVFRAPEAPSSSSKVCMIGECTRALFEGDWDPLMDRLDLLGEGVGVAGGGDGEMLRSLKVGFPLLVTAGTYSISLTSSLFFPLTLVLMKGEGRMVWWK